MALTQQLELDDVVSRGDDLDRNGGFAADGDRDAVATSDDAELDHAVAMADPGCRCSDPDVAPTARDPRRLRRRMPAAIGGRKSNRDRVDLMGRVRRAIGAEHHVVVPREEVRVGAAGREVAMPQRRDEQVAVGHDAVDLRS